MTHVVDIGLITLEEQCCGPVVRKCYNVILMLLSLTLGSKNLRCATDPKTQAIRQSSKLPIVNGMSMHKIQLVPNHKLHTSRSSLVPTFSSIEDARSLSSWLSTTTRLSGSEAHDA